MKIRTKDEKKVIIYRLLSFLIASSLITFVFLFNKMNGKDFLVIRGDFLDSVGFYKDFARNIKNLDSIYFNYSTGLGINNSMVVSGLFSPFNIFYLIFDKINVDTITAITVILKIGFAALAFQFFSDRYIKNLAFSSVLISVFYSLNAYSIEYGTIQCAWLDMLIILPLLCGSIIECLENDKRINLIILYACLFIQQFYFGYMIGIFTLLFVILYLVFIYQKNNEHKIQDLLTKFFNWALGVLIAIMLSAFVWVPTLFFLTSNRVPDSTEVVELKASLLQIVNSLFWGMDYGIEGTYSYIYCGIPVLILVPLFFMNRNIKKNLKWFSGILITIFLLSMVSNRLNLIWHVFDQPDDFWYRYSFMLCFCLCVISSIELANFQENINNTLIYIVLALIVLYQLSLNMTSFWEIDKGTLNSNYGFIINFILIISWCVILYISFGKKKYKILCLFLSILILGFELVSNSKRQMTNRILANPYNIWIESVESIVDEIQNNDKGFYRTIIAKNNIGYNSDTFFGLNGIGDFGNQEKYSVRNFLSNVGFATSPRVTGENGYSPVSEMILGVKYEINAPEVHVREIDSDISAVVEEDTESDLINTDINYKKNLDCGYLVNDYALNIGYLVNGNIILYDYSGRNAFENMNKLVSTMSGIDEDCFVLVPLDDVIFDSDDIELVEMDTGEFVFSRSGSEGQMMISVPKVAYEEAYIQFEKDDVGIHGIDYFALDAQNAPSLVLSRLAVSSVIKMNSTDDGKSFATTIGSYEGYSPEYFVCEGINVYYLNKDSLKAQYEELSKNQLEISSYSNGHIEGSVHSDGNKNLLFTTIPYDPGWKAYINGQEVEPIRVIDGAFMAIMLPSEGDYQISFDFECPGLKIGEIISICGIFAFLSVIFEKKLKNKQDIKKVQN